ncbi:putative leader peptide [Yinghuangia sp. ASG 101]
MSRVRPRHRATSHGVPVRPRLVGRPHVDLRRQASALCRRAG